jgi:hypothetical protein
MAAAICTVTMGAPRGFAIDFVPNGFAEAMTSQDAFGHEFIPLFCKP